MIAKGIHIYLFTEVQNFANFAGSGGGWGGEEKVLDSWLKEAVN